jgi:hypothetical protein
MSASITDRVNQLAEDLKQEESAPLRERSLLELTYEVSESGTVTEVTAVVTVGGPHIEIECLNGVVAGHWGGESYRRGIEVENVREFGRRHAERMESRID